MANTMNRMTFISSSRALFLHVFSLIAFGAYLIGCLSPVDSIVDVDESPLLFAMQDTLVLTDEAPSARVAVDPETIKAALRTLDVPLVRLERGTQASFSIAVSLDWDARLGPDKQVALGTFSAERTGTYSLDIAEALAITSSWGDPEQLYLSYQLSPAAGNTSLTDIRVYLAPAIWRGE